MFGPINSFLSNVINLIFPPSCAVCQDTQALNKTNCLCDKCLAQIKFIKKPYCVKCGRQLNNEVSPSVCAQCKTKIFYFERNFAACGYEGIIKECLHKFKYNKRLYLRKFLSGLLDDHVKENIDFDGIDYLIPVALHKNRLKKRGFNQAEELAKILAKNTGIRILNSALIRTRPTPSQTIYFRNDRLNNIKGAFAVKRSSRISGKNLILVDDIYTTGATLNECAKVLKKAGAKKVYCVTLAR